MISLIVSETVHCQTFVRNKKGEIVGVISGKDTLHAIPINESRKIHELAVKKLVLDHKIKIQDSIMFNLQFRIYELESGYENLLTNSGSTANALRRQLATARDEKIDIQQELRKVKTKLFWSRVWTGAVVIVSGVIIWLVAK